MEIDFFLSSFLVKKGMLIFTLRSRWLEIKNDHKHGKKPYKWSLHRCIRKLALLATGDPRIIQLSVLFYYAILALSNGFLTKKYEYTICLIWLKTTSNPY